MNSHKLFYICVVLLFTFGSAQKSGKKTLADHKRDVQKLATGSKSINGIFEPFVNGHRGEGSFAFTYTGMLLPIKKEIAMKFTLLEKKHLAEAEYEMYSYLRAINSSEVERYGIPAVYYYGEWIRHDVIMMGLTLLDKEVLSDEVVKSDVNILIVLRDFILTSKYVHSCNVRHDDVKLANMMTLKSRTFLIDFNLGHKLNVKSNAGSDKSRRAFGNGHRYPKDDWESFLYSTCNNLKIKFQWDGKDDPIEILRLMKDTKETIKRIGRIRSLKICNIFNSFAAHIFDDGGELESNEEGNFGENSFYLSHPNVEHRFPDYDSFYKFVNDEIEASNSKKPVMFSWLKGITKEDAIDDLIKHPIPDITKMEKPTNQNYKVFEYPPVDKEYFTRAYKDWKPDASKIMRSSSIKSVGSSSKRKSQYD